MTVGGGRSDIVNLDFVFHSDAQPIQDDENVLKAGKGKDKKDKKVKKDKKKKKGHSSSDSDDGRGERERQSNRSIVVPGEERVQQQEAVDAGRNRHTSREDLPPIADEESRTVRGPIRRKPLIFPHDS